MSVVVGVDIQVSEGEATYVKVVRVETVMPVDPVDDHDMVSRRDLDLADLIRVVLERLVSEAQDTADEQVQQLRQLLERAQ